MRPGSRRWSKVSSSGRTRPSGSCLRFVDVTERRRAEQAQRALEERVQALQKIQSLELLAGGVAHDFNNLLTVITSATEVALEVIDPGSRAVKPLENVLASAGHGAGLARQMLLYAGKRSFTKQPLDAAALVREVSSLARAAARSVPITFDIPSEAIVVDADSTQLRQLLLNLVTNAAEALSNRSGTIRVSLSVRDLAANEIDRDAPSAAGRFVALEVRDTGPGMSAETRSKIFDPFFSTKFVGRGLGLAVVQGIVAATRPPSG